MTERTDETDFSKASAFLPLNPRDVLILLALAEEPLHGYGLIQEAESLSEGRVRMDPANLYRSLKRMERDGLVAEARDTEPGEQLTDRRRVYGITALGRTVVAEEADRLRRLAEAAQARDLLTPDSR